jgi:hypothetical protein
MSKDAPRTQNEATDSIVQLPEAIKHDENLGWVLEITVELYVT